VSETVSEVVAFTLSGLVTGAAVALLACGLTLSYAATGMFAFAHGAIGFTGALIFYQLTAATWPVWPALTATLAAAGALGWLLHRFMFRALATAGQTAQTVAMIALIIALPALGLWLIEVSGLPEATQGTVPRGLGPRPVQVWRIWDGVRVDSDQAVVLAAAAVTAAALWLLLRHTRLGLRTRATVDRRELAALRGIAIDAISAQAWMLSCVLAALAGMLAAPTLGLDATAFTTLLFVSAAAAVFGRLESIPITFAAGLTLGVVQNLVAGYAGAAVQVTGIRTAVPAALLLGGLVWRNRPAGRVAGSATEDVPPPDYLARLPRWRRMLPWAAGTATVLVWSHTAGDTYWVGVVAQGLALSLIFLSYVLVVGLGGMVNLAQAAFAALAALTAGLCLSRGVPFPVAAAIGVLAAVAAGLVVALVSLRLGGRILTLATLTLALLADQVLFQIDALTNGTTGWPLPAISLGFTDTNDPATRVAVTLALLGATGLMIRRLERSATGRAILAVRSSPAGAALVGISPVRAKIVLLAAASAIAGLGGIVYAMWNGQITATDLPTQAGFVWLAVVVLHGVRRVGGAVLAGLTMALVPELLSYVTSSQYIGAIVFGLGGIALARHPDGVLAHFAERRHRYHERRQPARRLERRRPHGRVRRGQASAPTGSRGLPRASHSVPAAVRPGPDRGAGPGRGGLPGNLMVSGRAGDPQAAPALRLHRVVAGYGDAAALDGIALEVPAGGVVALLGANGAGKSTACAVAAGILPARAGSVLADGADITAWPAHRRSRAGIFLVPEGRGVFPGLTVEENLAVWLPPAGRAAAYDALPQLARRRNALAGTLSGGEQQMLALAPALARPPRVLIADEPSLGLAPPLAEQIFHLLAELRRRGVAMLLVDEKNSHALRLADTVTLMQHGRLVWTGPPAHVEAEQLTAAYLGMPGAAE
jgi:ABC-type branched-subunit amino acid transport system ATPase component/branched-subunit amino acid ABC-type transport system permease component